MFLFGCVADDFTGASDAASFLAKGGMRVLLFNGIPSAEDIFPDTDACVIALKTRTQETESAVKDTLCAVRYLLERGAKQIYLKYCSTFDSTPKGNIGPIADAVMEYMEQAYTILCPALPINGRTVQGGRLYVNGIALDQSPMKDHPLTPMWDSRISCLMEPQSRYPCLELRQDIPDEEARKSIEDYGNTHPHFYIIPDFQKSDDAAGLVQRFGKLPLLTGGSGLLEELAYYHGFSAVSQNVYRQNTVGPAVLLAGSCSKATREQIACYHSRGGSCLKIDVLSLFQGKTNARKIWDDLKTKEQKNVLIYTSETPESVAANQSYGGDGIAALLENALSEIAVCAVRDGYTRIIVAGGETSGAVTKKLGFSQFHIGKSIAPGVPVLIPVSRPEIQLVLKSGNFGQPDFFMRALEMTQ